jgi:hypothetical protein
MRYEIEISIEAQTAVQAKTILLAIRGGRRLALLAFCTPASRRSTSCSVCSIGWVLARTSRKGEITFHLGDNNPPVKGEIGFSRLFSLLLLGL